MRVYICVYIYVCVYIYICIYTYLKNIVYTTFNYKKTYDFHEIALSLLAKNAITKSIRFMQMLI